jgi:hypothetical protein
LESLAKSYQNASNLTPDDARMLDEKLSEVLDMTLCLSKKARTSNAEMQNYLFTWCTHFHEEHDVEYIQILEILHQAYLEISRKTSISVEEIIETLTKHGDIAGYVSKYRIKIISEDKAFAIIREINAVKIQLEKIERILSSQETELENLKNEQEEINQQCKIHSRTIIEQSNLIRANKGSKAIHKQKIDKAKTLRNALRLKKEESLRKEQSLQSEITILRRDIVTHKLLMRDLLSKMGTNICLEQETT